jgi:hypothetical protein
MRAAQSEGLFCDAKTALDAVRAQPAADSDSLLKTIRNRLRPLAPAAPPRDPRTLSSSALIQAASNLAGPSDDDRHSRPIGLDALDLVAPPMRLAELPGALHADTACECLPCVICACPLISDDELPIRQLGCSHAFHDICVAPWLTEQDASCPVCRARVEPPEETRPCRERSLSAYERWLELKGDGIQEEMRAREAAREAEWRRLDRLDLERAAQRLSVAPVCF